MLNINCPVCSIFPGRNLLPAPGSRSIARTTHTAVPGAVPGAVPASGAAPQLWEPLRAEPGPSLTGLQPFWGLAQPQRQSSSQEFVQEKHRVPVYWEGHTQGSAQPGLCPSRGSAWAPPAASQRAQGSISLCRAGPGAAVAGEEVLGIPQQHHTTHCCHCGQNLSWSTAPRAAAALCCGQHRPLCAPVMGGRWKPHPRGEEWLWDPHSSQGDVQGEIKSLPGAAFQRLWVLLCCNEN